MSVVVHPGRLRQEMARRGLAAAELARRARLSQATVSSALAGRPIAERSLAMIASVLRNTPVVDVIDSLIMSDAGDQLGM